MKRSHSPQHEVIDLTDEKECSAPKVSRTISQSSPTNGTPRPNQAARRRAELSGAGRAHQRYFQSLHPNGSSTAKQRRRHHEESRRENAWASFPGPDVFSHPSERFRTFLNPNPDHFVVVAEQISSSLPLSKPGELVMSPVSTGTG
jgi:hypothetical protein